MTDSFPFDLRGYNAVCAAAMEKWAAALTLPDGGRGVGKLADAAPGGAFDPHRLDSLTPEALGYRSKWIVSRYTHYDLAWDITGLKLTSLQPQASELPWVVIVHGGSANFYEFFVDPLNNPGLGQYLAQRLNVLLVTIPGNYKNGGWRQPPGERLPEYLLDERLPPGEVRIRHTIFTNRLVFSGLRKLVMEATHGDCLIVGHSTSGELAFMALNDAELSARIKGRFLGWGTGGPAGWRKRWEEEAGRRRRSVEKLAAFPPLWQLRSRAAQEYADSGYVGPLNPCRNGDGSDLKTAIKWLSLEQRRRPNFKQVMQDMEHRGMTELSDRLRTQVMQAVASGNRPVKPAEVCADMFAASRMPWPAIREGIWVVGGLDRGHWNSEDPQSAREMRVVAQLRKYLPNSKLGLMVPEIPMTHYGHIEDPKAVAACLMAAAQWLST